MLLEEMKAVFQGQVGTCQGIKVDFELCRGTKLKYSQSYSILVALEQVTKNVIVMMCNQGILKEVQVNTEWPLKYLQCPKNRRSKNC